MPQVAARINEQQERWLKDYFRTKSAGAEFILPWAVDTFFRAITTIKGTFTGPELKTILEAHRDQRLLPAHTRLSYLLLRVADLCEQTDFHSRYGASRTSLEAKLKRLDDTEATALMVWASAFWVSRNCSAANMDDYIASIKPSMPVSLSGYAPHARKAGAFFIEILLAGKRKCSGERFPFLTTLHSSRFNGF